VQEHSRSVIAAVAYAVISGKSVSSIYSHSEGSWRTVEARCSNGNISAYDFSRSSHFDGNLPNLYDYADSSHVEMNINGTKANGYHYGSSSFYEVSVNGNSVEFYDYESGGWASYSV
jgi:hypothetical protein